MTSPIFYLDAETVEAAEPGSSVELTGAEGHHAKNVKRLEIGEAVDLADGQGNRLVCTVESLEDDGLRLLVSERVFERPTLQIYLVQALAKHDRDLMGIETATELGVCGVVPWAADRSIVQWKGARAEKAHAKWEKTVVAAAKQSRRALIPTVFDLYSTNQLADFIGETRAEGSAVFVLHERENQQLTDRLRALSSEVPAEIYLVVGPEGGISDREIELFSAAGAQPVLLGSEILRSSTAGSAAIAAINTILGRW